MVNFCPYCGEALRAAENVFCPYCGRSLPAVPDAIAVIHRYGIADKIRAALPVEKLEMTTYSSSRAAFTVHEVVQIFTRQRALLLVFVERYPDELYYSRLAEGTACVLSGLKEHPAAFPSAAEWELIANQYAFFITAAYCLEQKDANGYRQEIERWLAEARVLERILKNGVSGCEAGAAPKSPQEKTVVAGDDFDPSVRNQITDLMAELQEMKPSFVRHTFNPEINYWRELEQLIGLNGVKEQLRNHIQDFRTQTLRKKMHPDLKMSTSFNCIFKGRPGTGKTTVARLIAGILKSEGIIENGCCVEVDASSLISGYIGFSAKVAKLAALQAFGGVLFIDEAYALMNSQGMKSNPGNEVIDTLTPIMENYRDKLIIVLAGYDKEMDDFMTKANTGFPSRFKTVIAFEDYTAEEMMQIFCKLADAEHYRLEDNAFTRLAMLLQSVDARKKQNAAFANARTVRSLFEVIRGRASRRMASMKNADMDLIMVEDVSLTRNELESIKAL